MKFLVVLILGLSAITGSSQNTDSRISQLASGKFFLQDTLITVSANPTAGFRNDYLLFIPRGTSKGRKTTLLVEPNNSGFTSDSLEKHREAAIFVATERSIGNNASTELKIPFLVPIFPRPKDRPLVYTHALDRDAMTSEDEDIQRLDLQLKAMIKDARTLLARLEVPVEEKVLMTGFSASGSFVNRFAFLHPEILKAVAAGGLNGILMLPKKEMNFYSLNYPLGINDLQAITGKDFDLQAYRELPQFFFMGALDDNDAVPYDDAYSSEERQLIFNTVGKEMQPQRWEKCQQIYRDEGVNARFRTYEEVGHWSTGEINLEVIYFLKAHI